MPLSSKNWRTATDKLNYLHQATANGEGYTECIDGRSKLGDTCVSESNSCFS